MKVNDEYLDKFRNSIDTDIILNKKKKLLITLGVLSIAISCSGASIDEVNTFIFKVKFSNQIGLSYLLHAAIIYLTLRYYACAKTYHDQLFCFWSQRMLCDYRVFYYDDKQYEAYGYLSKIIDVWGGDEPGQQSLHYKITGLFKRSLMYSAGQIDELGQRYPGYDKVDLFSFNDNWSLKDYIMILCFETRYQASALFTSRESLDLLFPYILSFISVTYFMVSNFLM